MLTNPWVCHVVMHPRLDVHPTFEDLTPEVKPKSLYLYSPSLTSRSKSCLYELAADFGTSQLTISVSHPSVATSPKTLSQSKARIEGIHDSSPLDV